jgi:hypothetical protein
LESDNIVVPEELSTEDLALLPEKERNKILNQRTRDAKKAERESTRATAKAVRDSTAQKGAKKGEKPGKSKVITPQLLLTETSTATPSQNLRKRDSSIAHLSVSRLQQLASPSLMDSAGGGVCMFRSTSSLDPYFPLMHTMWSTMPSPRNGWI